MTGSLPEYACFQEGARRKRAALAGIPDRVPVSAQIHEFTMRQMGLPAREFYSRPEILVPAELEMQRAYGLDVASLTYDVYSIEAEALGQKLVFGADLVPDVDRSAPLIRDRDDLRALTTPDFETAGRCPLVVEMFSLFRSLTGLEPTISFTAPFTLACSLRGIEQLIADIYTEPDFAAGLFDRLCEEVLAPWILYQKRCFPAATTARGVDATASVPIVNLRLLRDWAARYLLRLRELTGLEVVVDNWVGEAHLKRPAEMLDLKLALSPGALLGQDPDVERLGPEFYRRYADEHEASLTLGVGAGFLALSTRDQIAARVRHYIAAGGPHGRFSLYLCNVGGTTPPENLRAAVAAAHSFVY